MVVGPSGSYDIVVKYHNCHRPGEVDRWDGEGAGGTLEARRACSPVRTHTCTEPSTLQVT